MKLSKVEKIVLAVFLIIVIFAVGIFTFIMPELNKIGDNTLAFANAVIDRDNVYATLARETTIDSEIQTAIDAANAAGQKFYDELTPYEADVLVRDILNANKLKTKTLEISAFSTSDLTVVKYVDAGVQYPLRDYANFNYSSSEATGTTTAAAATDATTPVITPTWTDDQGAVIEPTKDQYLEYLSTQVQSVGSINVQFEVTGTRADFIKFLDYVKDLPQATYIDATTVAYSEDTQATLDDEGNVLVPSASQQLTATSEVTIQVSLTFFSVEKINQELINQAEAALS